MATTTIHSTAIMRRDECNVQRERQNEMLNSKLRQHMSYIENAMKNHFIEIHRIHYITHKASCMKQHTHTLKHAIEKSNTQKKLTLRFHTLGSARFVATIIAFNF